MIKKLSGISKKSKMIAATAFVLGLVALGGVASVSAAETPKAHNPMSAVVSAIASKFNLNTADVQAVVDETMKTQRAEMGAKMQGNIESRLAQAVTDGKITQDQADLITAKAAELKESMKDGFEDSKDLTQEERKEKMEERMDSLKEWAEDNDIPEEYLRFIGGGGKGFGDPGGHGGPRPAMTR